MFLMSVRVFVYVLMPGFHMGRESLDVERLIFQAPESRESQIWSWKHGGHLSRKPGNVRELDGCQGTVSELTKSRGIVGEKILSWKISSHLGQDTSSIIGQMCIFVLHYMFITVVIVITLLVRITLVSATWGAVPLRVGVMSGNVACLEKGHRVKK